MINLNVFKNLKTSTSFVSVDISMILEAIETGKFTHNNHVIHTGAKEASVEDKYDDEVYIDGVNRYNYLKLNMVKSYTPNASFHDNHRKTSKVNKLSGLVYCDIDNVDPVEAKRVVSKLRFVYAAWSSLSGTGIGFLVKASHLTPENFKQQYQALSSYFNKIHRIELDKTSDITRTNVFSYDPEIYINQNATDIEPELLSNFIEVPKTYTRNSTVFDDDIEASKKVKIAIKYALKSKGEFLPGNRHFFLTSLIGTAIRMELEYDELLEGFESYLQDIGDLDLLDLEHFDKTYNYFVENYS